MHCQVVALGGEKRAGVHLIPHCRVNGLVKAEKRWSKNQSQVQQENTSRAKLPIQKSDYQSQDRLVYKAKTPPANWPRSQVNHKQLSLIKRELRKARGLQSWAKPQLPVGLAFRP